MEAILEPYMEKMFVAKIRKLADNSSVNYAVFRVKYYFFPGQIVKPSAMFGKMKSNTMENQLIGSFYFQINDNHDLTGEFANNGSDEKREMKATKKPDSGNGELIFECSWYDNCSHNSVLKITEKADKIYELIWIEDGKPTYSGEAFLRDDEKTLIGYYYEEPTV